MSWHVTDVRICLAFSPAEILKVYSSNKDVIE